MHNFRVVALNKVGLIASTHIESLQVGVTGASLSGRPRDLVPIEMKDWQNRAVSHRIEEVDRLPASFQRAGLGLAIADDAGDNQIRIVEGRAEGVNQRVTKLSALVHGVRDVRPAVARHAARGRELAEHQPQAVFIVCDLWVNLSV